MDDNGRPVEQPDDDDFLEQEVKRLHIIEWRLY